MIIFDRKAGTLTMSDGTVFHGIWAGHGEAVNDVSRECEKNVGPLPHGVYTFSQPYHSNRTGPFTLALAMIEGDPCGRSAFRIHGDNSTPDKYDASDGCIIANRNIRVRIDKEQDRRIRVI